MSQLGGKTQLPRRVDANTHAHSHAYADTRTHTQANSVFTKYPSPPGIVKHFKQTTKKRSRTSDRECYQNYFYVGTRGKQNEVLIIVLKIHAPKTN